MSKAITIIDMPETCGECLFCSVLTEMYLGNGFYKKFGKCMLAKNIEDPWRSAYWQSEHKEDWCPLKPVPKYFTNFGGEDDYADGYNDCLNEILGD